MPKSPNLPTRNTPQHASLALAFGKRSGLTVDVTVTPSGLLAIGALVSAILLSTSVIVHAGRR